MSRAFNPLTPPIDASTPGVVTIVDPDPTIRWTPSLNNTTDYILQCPTMRTKPITINGGRHVYIFGLWIQLDTAGLGEMVKFVGGASGGIRHIERGLLDANNIESDCFKTSNFDNGVVQLKYVRVENLTGNTASVHADLFQSSGGCGELWVEDFSGFTDYAGFQMQREATVDSNNTAWTITGAVRTGNSVVFTATGHGLAVGDFAGVANVVNSGTNSPDGYNGGHTVTARTVNTFTVLLGDLTPGTYTSGGLVQKMAFAYNVGDVRFNRINVVGRTSSGSPTSTLQMYRFGARTAPTPDPTDINQTAYIRQNEDKTRLTYEAWFGEFEATDTYGLPVSGNIDTFVEPDSNVNNYSVIRPVLDTSTTPDQITYPSHPQVKAGTIVRYGNPPGGDYCTHAQALDWTTTGGGGGGGGTPTTPVTVQEVGATSSVAATSITATWPAATGTGNLLILGLVYADNALTVSATVPAGWTPIGTTPVTALGAGTPKASCALYYKANATSESGAKTVTFNQAVYASMFLAEWDGIDPVPLDKQASASSTGSTNISTGTTPVVSAAGELAIALVGANSNFSMSAPQNGYTIQDTKASAASGTARVTAGLLYKIMSATAVWSQTPTTHIYDRAAAGTVSSKLSALITAAAADRTYTPVQETFALPLGSQVCGPNAAQGVVRIEFDPSAGVGTGANRIVLDANVSFASNVRLEIDAGVALVDNTGSAVGMFTTNTFDNWSITPGDQSRNSGYYIIDTSFDTANLKSRLTHCQNSTNWKIEWVESIQTPNTSSSATGFLPFHPPVGTVTGDGFTKHPRNFIYRHHKNSGSAAGWGPNQVAGAQNGYIEKISTIGGTCLRCETDGLGTSTNGLQNILAVGPFYGENGNRVVTFTPHTANSDHVVVTGVYGVNMYGGAFAGADTGGTFTNSSITTGCIVAGTTAQDPAAPPATIQSFKAIEDNHTISATLTISGIGRSGTFSSGTPGGDLSVTCNATVAGTGKTGANTVGTPPTGVEWTGVTLSTSNPNVGKIATFKSMFNPSTLGNTTGLIKVTGLGSVLTVIGVPGSVVTGTGKTDTPRS